MATVTATAAHEQRRGFDPTRRAAFAAGVLYLLTFAGSIPASLLLPPTLSGANYIVGPGAGAPIGLAAVLELLNALTCFGTAVAVFSIVRREHEGLAIGFITTRMFEAATIVVGIVSILALSSARQAAMAAGSDLQSLVPVGHALVGVRDWTMVIGPGMASLNALMFGTLLYRARLVPRAIPALGLVGAPLFISFVVGTILGVTGPGTAWQGISVAPFFFWELAVGLWMTFKGFDRSSPIVQELTAEAAARSAALRHRDVAPAVSGSTVATKAGAA